MKALWQYHQQPDNDIVTDSRGRKWRATHRGIILNDGPDSLLLTTADGLPSNYILEADLLLQIQQLMQAAVPQTEPAEEESAEEETSAEDAAFVQDAISQVERHLTESYSVEQLAKDLCMERTGLYKRLTAIVNQSPQTFIRSIRLNHAATMLRSGATVTETSDACGFSSISYFSRAFTKEFGVSPSEYVKD